MPSHLAALAAVHADDGGRRVGRPGDAQLRAASKSLHARHSRRDGSAARSSADERRRPCSERELDRERRAGALDALARDRAAVRLDDRLRDREPEADAGIRIGLRLRRAVEALEQALLLRGARCPCRCPRPRSARGRPLDSRAPRRGRRRA